MENTEVKGTYKDLFEGKYENVIKCIKVDFESTREEVFNTLQLSVKQNATIQDSIRDYVAQEKLEGDNMYDTEQYGKQEARKFIRFTELPPVLQISLNRFDYDFQLNRMAKNNQEFKFDEVLDFESIMPPAENESCQNQSQKHSKWSHCKKTKVVNRYHLHSMLIHRGTLDYGHYYAYIRPNLDDRWFQFNDQQVREVTKEFAFKQGCGGMTSQMFFSMFGHSDFQEAKGAMYEKLEENNTNAYMLIYVRESERDKIMSDSLSLDEQIPKQLQEYFRKEEQIKSKINDDDKYLSSLYKAFIITEETMLNHQWDAGMLCQHFRKELAEGYRFESDVKSHHLIYIHQNISINEFIVMLKQKFFQEASNVELEDIWIYRILTQNN